MAVIETVTATAALAEVDELLWRVLWQPLGLPPDARGRFGIDGKEIVLAARERGKLVGGLVAVWTSRTEIELRHLAVAPEAQGKGIGRSLAAALSGIVAAKKGRRIHTIARSTSAGFFRRLGFQTAPGQAPEHPVFLAHSITFELMEKIVD
ncbi:MAG: GNAT family N-acetyltransferase [Desulfobulbaceae bacterium]|jgi:ribosomal protein S18 acetylase RimI-like enzyme|nr:GNAT family N-acetyltransferase [Desulfobulbaceae bacterium]MDY0350438.1 GNAT family N-acetyltransferase [Desulfobulbaceae bacterium]